MKSAIVIVGQNVSTPHLFIRHPLHPDIHPVPDMYARI